MLDKVLNTSLLINQLTSTCSKSTMETLEKVAKYVQSLTIKTPGNVIDVVQVFLLITLKIFTPFSSVSIVDFEQVNVSWVKFF